MIGWFYKYKWSSFFLSRRRASHNLVIIYESPVISAIPPPPDWSLRASSASLVCTFRHLNMTGGPWQHPQLFVEVEVLLLQLLVQLLSVGELEVVQHEVLHGEGGELGALVAGDCGRLTPRCSKNNTILYGKCRCQRERYSGNMLFFRTIISSL